MDTFELYRPNRNAHKDTQDICFCCASQTETKTVVHMVFSKKVPNLWVYTTDDKHFFTQGPALYGYKSTQTDKKQ